MSTSEVKFVKTERVCIHNKILRARGEKIGIIYDYCVEDAGEFVAKFKHASWKNSWLLYDRAELEITLTTLNDAGRKEVKRYYAKTIKDFAETYAAAKADNAIPTAEDIAERKVRIAQEVREQEAAQAERERVYRIKDAAEDLYKAAKALLEAFDVDRFEALRKTVMKAENPRSVEG